MWTCGDVFKTTYFYVRKTPPQFVICGLLQVMVDIAILAQVWMYYENTSRRKKASNFWHAEIDDVIDHSTSCALLDDVDELDIEDVLKPPQRPLLNHDDVTTPDDI